MREGPGGPTWADLVAWAGSVVGEREAWLVAEEASGRSRAELVVGGAEVVPRRMAEHARAMVERRRAGEPLQYVLGRWGFRGLDLVVDARVLIPRPETELVVEVAVAELRRIVPPRRRVPPLVADPGTGSGAIALAVANEVPRALVWGTDASSAALAVARANLAGTGSRIGPRVRLLEGRWLEPLPHQLRGRIDLVVSNPPYVAEGEQLPAEVALWEPAEALVAGPTGLEGVEAVVEGAARWLSRPGAVVVEIAPHQASAAAARAAGQGFDDVEVRPDLAGRPRVLVGRFAA